MTSRESQPACPREPPCDRLCRLLEPLHGAVRLTARRLCRSLPDGDDLLHEAVLRAIDRIDQLRDERSFRAWFYAVLLSVHRARSRRTFWRRFVPFFDDTTPEDATPAQATRDAHLGPPHAAEVLPLDEETRTRAARITAALQKLPAVQREAVVLFEVDGFSIEEVAAMQRVSISAVKSRLTRGRQRLRAHYERLGDGDDDSETAALWVPPHSVP